MSHPTHADESRGAGPATGESAPVLLVTQMFPPAVGGSGMLLESVYSRVHARVTVLTDRGTPTGDDATRGSLAIRRVDLDGGLWGVSARGSLRQHVRVARTIRRLAGRDGVVHCGRAQPEGVAALLASLWSHGPRFLFWAHGEEISTAQTSREFAWVMRCVYAGAAAAIANSRHTASLLEKAGMPSAKISVVYPGVDIDRFSSAVDAREVRQRFAPNGELLLVTVARLQPRKGHALAIAALGQLRDRLPRFHYVIVGDGPERGRLQAMAAECGIGDRVSFTGEVAAQELPTYLSACDIFVHPNRVVGGYDFEGFGLVFLEAAACGKPAIGGGTGGVPEAVQDGVTGLLVSGTNAEELAGAIDRLAQSPALRASMGAAGYERVRRSFNWEGAARAVETVHARVAADTPPLFQSRREQLLAVFRGHG